MSLLLQYGTIRKEFQNYIYSIHFDRMAKSVQKIFRECYFLLLIVSFLPLSLFVNWVLFVCVIFDADAQMVEIEDWSFDLFKGIAILCIGLLQYLRCLLDLFVQLVLLKSLFFTRDDGLAELVVLIVLAAIEVEVVLGSVKFH